MITQDLHTVGQVAALAGVTVRTLHHYDRVGLLVPSERSEQGYRLYDYGDLERLRQIRLLRELRFSLDAIGQMLDATAYDRRSALAGQRELLRERQERTEKIILGVDRALTAMEEEKEMDRTEMFAGLEEFDHAQYQEEAEERWGDTDAYKESMRRTRRYGKNDWARIKEEGEEVLARAGRPSRRRCPGGRALGHGPRGRAPVPHRPLVLPVQPRNAPGTGRDVHRGPALHGALRKAGCRAGHLLPGRDQGQRCPPAEPFVTPRDDEYAGQGTRPAAQDQDTRFRTTLLRVLLVQIVTLLLLWILQATYHA